jgi:dynein heavy chain
MRELSRVFQGMLVCSKEVICSSLCVGTSVLKQHEFLIALWKHECERTFKDKMTELKDQDKFQGMLNTTCQEIFEFDPASRVTESNIYFTDFLREDIEDPETGEMMPPPKVYEMVPTLDKLKIKVLEWQAKLNADPKFKLKMDLVYFL